MFIFGVLIVLQLTFVVTAVLFLTSIQIYLFAATRFLSFFIVLWILNNKDNPSYKLAWVVAIMTMPILGGLFYLFLGNKKISKELREKSEGYYDSILQYLPKRTQSHSYLADKNPLYARQAEYIYNMSHFPIWEKTAGEYLKDGEITFAKMKEELKKAQRFIMLEYFIVAPGVMWDGIFEILKEKAAQGVQVMLMYDDLGTIQLLPKYFPQMIRDAGIALTIFNPFRPKISTMVGYRDHRKICVIDGNVGFTGGINLADEYINAYEKHGHWKDTAVMIQGEGVWNLTLMFLQLWTFSNQTSLDFDSYRPTKAWENDGYVQPFSDSPLDRLNVSENAYMQMINHAKQYIYITTPYLILDNEMVTALSLAAQSGVDVRIMTPFIGDKWFVHPVTQSYYPPLLEAGVKIFEYTPGFVHAKMFVADGEVAIVGTTNMDFRSFYLHFECGIAFYYSSVVKAVEEDFLQCQAVCTPVTLEEENSIPLLKKLGRSILRIFSPLM